MGLPRSTFYDAPVVPVDDGVIVARITAICDEFEAYGYRRVGAELRHQGIVVNGKKLRWLMREHDLQPRRRRRYAITTDSDHDCPIFPDLAKNIVVARRSGWGAVLPHSEMLPRRNLLPHRDVPVASSYPAADGHT
jgi:putative transposase